MKPAAAGFLLLLVAAPARGEDAAALYHVYWAGAPAAELRLSVHDGADGYRNEIAIRAEGLARWVTHFRAVATASGRLVSGFLPAPASFEARYDLRKRRDRILSMRFVGRQGVRIAERGPGDTSRKPELKEEFRRNVIDPLGTLAAIRQQLRDRRGGDFAIPTYDGARRFDVVAHEETKADDKQGVVHLALTLRPIAGFKGETSEDGDPDDAPRPVALTLSGDGLMPLSLTVPVYYLPLTVEFVRWCTAAQPCPL